MKTQLIAYLTFDGKTAEAMKFYQSVFGGDLTMRTFADAFPDTREELRDRIMHAQLTNEEFSIMASDTHPEHGPTFTVGNNVSLSLVGEDKERLTEYFEKLKDGGEVVMPLEKQFWGDVYGVLVDKFGINWMVNIALEEETE